MNGFSDDIVSILKHNNMFHNKSLGFIAGKHSDSRVEKLIEFLTGQSLKVAGDRGKFTWDYIILPSTAITTRAVLLSLSTLNTGGIIILEITEAQRKYQEKYLRVGTSITATKVQYENRYYLVLHSGEDYGH